MEGAVTAGKDHAVVVVGNLANLVGEVTGTARSVDIDRIVFAAQTLDDIGELFCNFSPSAVGVVKKNAFHVSIIS